METIKIKTTKNQKVKKEENKIEELITPKDGDTINEEKKE